MIDDDVEDMYLVQLVDQMGDFLLWRVDGKETQDTQVIKGLVWQDG